MGTVGNFDDIIAEFSATYRAYIVINIVPNEDGTRQYSYKKVNLRGSLQTGGRRKVFNKGGANVIEHTYDLFTNSRNMLSEGDYVVDKKGNILKVISVDPWEVEGDYRKYSLTRTKYSENRLLDMFKGEEDSEEVDTDLVDELSSRMQ